MKVPGFELTDSQQAEKKVIDAQHEAWRALKVRQVIAMRANGQQPYVKPDPVTIAKRRHLGKLAKQARKAARAA